MSIRKVVFSLFVVLSFAVAGCSDDISGEEGIINCTADADCLVGTEICHPIGKVCVATCTMADDCPDTQKNCMEIKDAAGTALTTEMVCQCSTDALCTGDDLAEMVCSPVDNICEDKCLTDADCADFTGTVRECGATGACVIKVGATCTATSCTEPTASKCGTDGTCGACVADEDCAHLTGLNTCDNGTCVAPTCSATNQVPGTNGGPDICAYGEVCGGNGCADVAAGTCAGASSHTWNKAVQGPVVFQVTSQGYATSSQANPAECALKPDGSVPSKIEATISFYAPNGLTYSQVSKLLHNWTTDSAGQIVFVRSNGSTHGAAFVRDVPASGATHGTFVAGACGTQSIDGRAVYLKDSSGNAGNAGCL